MSSKNFFDDINEEDEEENLRIFFICSNGIQQKQIEIDCGCNMKSVRNKLSFIILIINLIAKTKRIRFHRIFKVSKLAIN